jgi:hypothetical protein
MARRHETHVRARALATVCQLQEGPHLIEREAERPRAANKGEPPEVCVPVQAVATRSASSAGKSPTRS